MKKCFKQFRILAVALILSLLVIPLYSQNVEAAVTLHEKLNTGQDADSNPIWGGNDTAMQFTSEATAHTVTKIRLYLERSGSPGTITAYLYTASGGLPDTTQYYLASGSYDGNNLGTSYGWCEFTMTFVTGVSNTLEASTEYAIVLKAPNGTVANYVLWGTDSGGGLASAESSHSVDGGSTWTSDAPVDALFEVYGDTVLQIYGANVFEDYLTTGTPTDLLFCIDALNIYPPDINLYNPQDRFQVQLLDPTGATILAATPMTAWGRRPQSIYLSSSAATPITRSGNYVIRMIGMSGASPPSTTYTLQSSDWKGTDLTYLDKWIDMEANSITLYYNYSPGTLNTYITDIGIVLTDTGGGIFTNAIPGISQVRPNKFATPKSKPIFPTATNASIYDQHGLGPTPTASPYRVLLGTEVADDLDTFGNLFNISGQNMGGWLIGLLVAFIIFVGMILGGRAALAVGVVSGIPIMFIGNYTGLLGIQYTLILAIILVALFAWWFYPRG